MSGIQLAICVTVVVMIVALSLITRRPASPSRTRLLQAVAALGGGVVLGLGALTSEHLRVFNAVVGVVSILVAIRSFLVLRRERAVK